MIPKNSLISPLLLAVLSLQSTPLGAAQMPSREVKQVRARYLTADGTVVRPIADLMRQTGYSKKGPITLDAAVDWTQEKWRDLNYSINSEKRVLPEEHAVAINRCLRDLKVTGTNVSAPKDSAKRACTTVLFHGEIYPMITERAVALHKLASSALVGHLLFVTDNSDRHNAIVQRPPAELYHELFTCVKPDAQLEPFRKPQNKSEVFDCVWKVLEFQKQFPSVTLHRTEIGNLTKFLQEHPELPKRLLLVSSGYSYAGDILILQSRLGDMDYTVAGGASHTASEEQFDIFKRHMQIKDPQYMNRFSLNTLARTLWLLKKTRNT